MRRLDDLLATGIWRELVEEHGSPLVIVDAEIIRERCRELRAAFPYAGFYFAPKANYNPWIVREIVAEGFGIDAVSPLEIELALSVGVPPSDIVYVENAMSPDDLDFAIEADVRLVIGSRGALRRYAEKRPGTEIGIRLNGDIGASEHAYTYTSGPKSKFGIHASHLAEARAIAAAADVTITSLQQHIGSNWLDPEPFLDAARALCEVAKDFPDVTALDFGGGFGVPYRESDHRLDVERLGKALAELLGQYRTAAREPYHVAFEPGRYIVAESAAIITRVNDRKVGVNDRIFAATDTGFNHLIRPALYGSQHRILNLTSPDASPETVDVCGNLCEETDYLARDRSLPSPSEGDYLAIMDVGAYGLSQASDYNLRPIPPEIMVDGDDRHLIRRRRTFGELMSPFDF